MITYEAVGITDTGQVRQANEDAFFLGDSVFAVADGMGGHVAGEVASNTALGPVSTLDGRIFSDPAEATEVLVEAVEAANSAVVTRTLEDPELRGMGTTLTVALVAGRRLHIAHVGDSRAYLIRDGAIAQITTDHTLVQHLIDMGDITPEEAAVHPQRSIITRAIGVSPTVEVDRLTVELQVGDRILLCSDGLSGVLSDDEIGEVVLSAEGDDVALDLLVARANGRGGPDNITAVLLHVDEDGASGAATSQRQVIRPVNDDADTLDEDDWAAKLQRIGTLGKAAESSVGEPAASGSSRRQRIAAIAVVSVVLVSAAFLGGRWLVSRSYYVGQDAGQVAIYRGVPTGLGPFSLSWVEERTALSVDDVPAFYKKRLAAGIPATDLADARLIVENAPRRAGATPTPSATATPSPSASPAPSPAAP